MNGLRGIFSKAMAWFTLPRIVAVAAAAAVVVGGAAAAVTLSKRNQSEAQEERTEAVSLSEEAAEPASEDAGLFTLPVVPAEEFPLTLPPQSTSETQPFTAATLEPISVTAPESISETSVFIAETTTTAAAITEAPATTTATAAATTTAMAVTTTAAPTTTRAPTTARTTTTTTTTRYQYTQTTARPTTARATTASRATASTASTSSRSTTSSNAVVVSFLDAQGVRVKTATVTGTSRNVLSHTLRALDGWNVRGWTASMEPGAPAEYNSGANIPVSGTITYYGVYESKTTKTYTFDSQGGAPKPASITIGITRISCVDMSKPVPTTITMPTAPTRTGYTFVAWEDNNGNRYNPGQKCLPDSTAIKAVWA